MNRLTRFSEDWISPVDQRKSFGLIASGFIDSRMSPVWPTEYSEFHLDAPMGTGLQRGAVLKVIYKFGPLRRSVEYRIVEVIEPRYIQYETTANHPLAGGGRVYFRALYGGKTLCKWEGGYRIRKTFGYAALAWFKNFYERQFFRAMRERFEAIAPAPQEEVPLKGVKAAKIG